VPSRPHVAGASAAQSLPCVLPAATSAHVPLGLPVSAVVHAWQLGQLAVLQQTPSTQLPLAHCDPAEQP
jgi:hypothetical protein